METLSEKATCAEQGLRSTFWTDFMMPHITEMCKNKGRRLIISRNDDDDITRGWVQALEWVMNLPHETIADAARADESAAAEERERHDDEWRADHGFRSPIRQAPEPGELKSEEA